MSDVEATLVSFIGDKLLGGQTRGFDANTALLDLGILDSMSTLVLLAFIEKQFGLAIPLEEIKPDDLETVVRLADLIRRRQSV